VLSQLSVFRGGFSRQAAEQVAGASLPVLSTLVNRTLLRRAESGRYHLHFLVRQYCANHLEVDPQVYFAVQKRHYDYFLALAEISKQGLNGRNQLEWLRRLEQEQDNLRVALEWALEHDRTTLSKDELALRLSGTLRRFWRMHGHFHEGLGWLTKSLQQPPEGRTVARATALLGKSTLIYALGDIGAASSLVEESEAIYRELDDQDGLAEALASKGNMLVWQGEGNLGKVRLEEALAIFRRSGDRYGEAWALYRLGTLLADYGGDPSGRAMLEESVTILEELGEKYLLTSALISLGIVDEGLGDYAGARIRLEHALAIAREIEHHLGIADALTNLGCVCRILGEYSVAQSYFEECQKVYQVRGCSIWGTDVLCAQAENAISQGDLATARFRLQEASDLLGATENKWLQTLVCFFRGLLAHYEGDAASATMLLEETVALAQAGQFKPDLARALIALGRVKRTLGEFGQATELILEGLNLFRTFGHKLGIANSIEELGAMSVAQGDGLQAVRLFSTANTLREEMGALLPPVDRAAHESVVAACRSQLGEVAFARAWAEGKTFSLEQAVTYRDIK